MRATKLGMPASVPQVLELPANFEELSWLAHLDDATLFENQDPIEVEYRVESVRDGDDGVPYKFLTDHLLDHPLRVLVNAAKHQC